MLFIIVLVLLDDLWYMWYIFYISYLSGIYLVILWYRVIYLIDISSASVLALALVLLHNTIYSVLSSTIYYGLVIIQYIQLYTSLSLVYNIVIRIPVFFVRLSLFVVEIVKYIYLLY